MGSAKKPWRYYYVLTFPLSTRMAKDKLASIVELTETMERREEEYVRRVVARNEQPRPRAPPSPLVAYIASCLRWLSGVMMALGLVLFMAIYVLHWSAMSEQIQPMAITVAYGVAVFVMVFNGLLFVCVSQQHTRVLYVLAFLLALTLTGIAFMLDQLKSIRVTQYALSDALRHSRRQFTPQLADLVLNGGDLPSLWHRFFADGPAWFLLWLEQRCSSTERSDDVDGNDFFTPFWKGNVKTCAETCLSTHLWLEGIVQGVLTTFFVVQSAQLVLLGLFLWSHDSDVDDSVQRNVAASKNRRPKRRRRQDRRAQQPTDASTWSIFSIVKISIFGLFLSGTTLVVVGGTLLNSCDFDDTTSWILMGVTAFGVIQLVVALLASLEWRTQLVQSFLLASLALESYVNGSLEALIADLAIGPLSSTGSSSSMVGLRDAYDSVFMQTCQPVKRWRLHVCVDMSTAPTPHGHKMLQLFDSPVCQTEFTSLLLATAQHSLTLISWMMLAQAIVLLWFLLPHIQARFKSALAVCCCVSDISVSPSVSMKSLAEQKAGDSSTSTSTSWRQPSLAFEEAQRLYLETLKCADTTRRLAEAAAFETEWMKMTGRKTTETSSGAVMFVTQFEAITRTLILRRLTERCKLDVSLSISAHGRWLVVKIFASDNLLMTTLCHESTYKLQVADAVDPGRAFWQDMREVKADNKVLDPHTIHQKFKLLLQRGAVAQKEAERVPSESLASVSARAHALMRIHRASKDALRCRNTHLPFVAYTPQTHLQYLYKKYPNQLDMEGVTRRSAVLRTIDCLRLTRRILDTEFDLDHMRHQNILVDFTSLHSASRLDVTSRDTLLSSWVAFWRPQYLPGEFEPETHWFLNQLGRLSPFRQPLRDVRDYFGECIAFYFSWLAFYNQLLLLPTVAVVILLAAHLLDMSPLSTLAAFYRSSHSAKTPFQPPAFVMRKSSMAFGLSIVLWGFIFAKLWSRRSVWYQLEWGMTDMELEMTDRANFRGETRRNPITQQLEIHFPGHKRLRRQVTSVLVILGVSVAHLILSTLLLLSQGVLAQWIGLRGGVTLSLVGLSLMIQWNGDHISMLSHYLSEWENYQNEPAFQQSVIFKVLALQIANTYAPLWIIAFGFWSFGDIGRSIPLLDSVTRAFRDRVESHTDAVIELQLVLWLIFLTRIASHMTAMIQGVLRESQRSEVSTERSVPSLHVETELALGIYRGSYEDYTEIVMQIGLIVMFSSIFPLAPVLAFVECALELRLDALDLCLFLRRPNPDVADGIGPWSTAVDVLLQLGLLVNLALLYFMASNYSSWSLVRRLGAYLGCVVLGWLVTQLLYAMVPSSSDSVREAQARNAFLIDRYFGSDRQSNYSDEAGGSDTKRDAVAAMTAEYEAAMNVEETSADTTHEVQPEHYRERLMLLHRLNVALRRQGETADLADLELSVQHDTDAEKEEHVEDQDESSEEEEQMIVGYIRRPLAPPEPVVEDVPKVTEPVLPAAESATTPLPSAPLSPPSPPPAPYHRATLSGMEAIQVASQRDRFDFAQGAEWRDSESPKVKSPPTRRRFSLFSRKKQASSESLEAAQASSAATTPVVQLSGLDAVHEATRRDHFDFSADPWREGGATL
ncbi:hypothetical protein Poli38472_014794 [Pythium oligandrum]|uniref:Anoctamin transmembrane domain-containing protein n=1 Tax=Pythium oligandrum TaxID=41045 RepID=A0A8K1FK70_PYTOL|nr:hypothetical protein Poli38472_014794 [Pythium oligandrum]|eukprot:TMW63884.1 hypothetical protein Poli38472_014794 [Pythium oligandrum]